MNTGNRIVLEVPVGPRECPVVVAVERARQPSADAIAALPRPEREQYAAMAPRRAAEFARGRTLLRWLAGTVLGIGADQVLADAAGRPRLSGRRAGLSLSHTDLTTAAAIWPGGDVGIDAEEPPASLSAGLVRRCCGERAAALDALPRQQRAAMFTRIWTVQEACVKARGLGLAGAPWRIPADPFARTGQWQELRWYALDVLAPTAVAVAVRLTGPPWTNHN